MIRPPPISTLFPYTTLFRSVGLGGKSAADKGKDTRDYLAAAFPELNAWERAGADASSAGMVDAGFENQKELTKMQLDNQKEIAEMQNETQKERSEERFSRNAETDLVCRLLLEKKKTRFSSCARLERIRAY